jgi:HAD superfamily hydrolase (TIGR01509 family)
MTAHLEAVFLDIGGTLYDDRWYSDALLRALRDLGAEVDEEEFRAEYDRWRRDPRGSFREAMGARFLGPGADPLVVTEAMARYWSYPTEALMPGAREALEALSGTYTVGIIADQQATVREALARDALDRFVHVWCVSADLGMEKPDLRVFETALERANVTEPRRAAMVGDRLDDDVRPARELGIRSVWVLTGKAPPDPTPEQLAEPDVAIRSLEDLPEALERL